VIAAGLSPEDISAHKLRHTAATLMYKYGHVDIRSLQQILGHESIATTEIYTHIDEAQLQAAVNANPLAMMFS
jgi:site-specific recombinase XerD